MLHLRSVTCSVNGYDLPMYAMKCMHVTLLAKLQLGPIEIAN